MLLSVFILLNRNFYMSQYICFGRQVNSKKISVQEQTSMCFKKRIMQTDPALISFIRDYVFKYTVQLFNYT